MWHDVARSRLTDEREHVQNVLFAYVWALEKSGNMDNFIYIPFEKLPCMKSRTERGSGV